MKVVVDGVYSSVYEILAGTPQGSVLSPILFNLMLHDIPKSDGIEILTYADDITILTTGNDITDVKLNLENYLKKFVQWTKDWGLHINPKKSVLQYFTRKKMSYPIIRMNKEVIHYKKVHKLLGLTIDSPKLTFKDHVAYLLKESQKRLDIMKSISSPSWGATPKTLKKFYVSYIRAKINYGAVVYAAGNKILDRLEVVQNNALRMITGGRRTSPILSLQAESNIPPLALQRGYNLVKEYIKLKCKPKNYSTSSFLGYDNHNITNVPFNSFTYRLKNYLQMFDIHIPRSFTESIHTIPPWETCYKYIILEYLEDVSDNITFNYYLDKYLPSSRYKYIYTDGSKTSVSVGSAFYISEYKICKCFKLSNEHSVISSELFAIYKALDYILIHNTISSYIIFTDSKSSLELILASNPSSYIDIVLKIKNLLYKLNLTNSVLLHWIKAHIGIKGNEIADQSANKAHTNDRIEYYNLAQSEYISKLKIKFQSYWNDYWSFTTSVSGKGLFLKQIRSNVAITSNAIDSIKNRKIRTVLTRLRIGHAGVQSYLYRFNMTEQEFCENTYCEQNEIEETIEHLLFQCPSHETHRNLMMTKYNQIGILNPNLKTILGGDDERRDNIVILKILIDFLKEIGRFDTL